MSKSKGNYYNLRDLLKRGFDPTAIRYLLLSVHYRKPLNFTFSALKQAESSLERLEELILKLKEEKLPRGRDEELGEAVQRAKAQFEEAMDDDLNTSAALGAIFTLIRQANISLSQGSVKEENKEEILSFLDSINAVFDILPEEAPEKLEPELQKLIKLRNKARQQKDFKRADEIREELLKRGIILQDTSDGVRWRRKPVGQKQ